MNVFFIPVVKKHPAGPPELIIYAQLGHAWPGLAFCPRQNQRDFTQTWPWPGLARPSRPEYFNFTVFVSPVKKTRSYVVLLYMWYYYICGTAIYVVLPYMNAFLPVKNTLRGHPN